jgi:hypothetical protein
MPDTDPCRLHEVAILVGADRSPELLTLGQSPIGDECRSCPVCRSARTYVRRRLDERSGRVLPEGEDGQAAWRELQRAVAAARSAIHPPR